MDMEMIDLLCELVPLYDDAERVSVALEEKKESYDDFLRLVRDFEDDDHTTIKEVVHKDGSISLEKYIYTIKVESFVTIDENGRIIEDGGIRVIEIMKEYGVRIIRKE